MIKSFVRAVFLLGIGAGIGVWFAPPNAKTYLRGQAIVVQKKAREFNSKVSSKWLANTEKSLGDASKKVDISKLNKRELSNWVKSVQNTYATVSEQAVRTQKSINAVNEFLQSARSEYKKHHEKLTGI